MTAAGRPAAGERAYYRIVWLGAPDDEPTIFWDEVDHHGNVLRAVEIYRSGRIEAKDIAHYPDRISDFGIGTLIGCDFYALEWDWPSADEQDPSVVLDATAFEFEQVWKGALEQ